MFCSSCGAQISDKSAFCPSCGKPVQQQSAQPQFNPNDPQTLLHRSTNAEKIAGNNTAYSFENTMYGTLGPERVVWDEEANEAMHKAVQKEKKK